MLSPADAAKVSKNDVTEPPDVDTDAVIVGQDSFLFWTDAGVKSDLAKDYASMDGPPQVGEPVDMLILMHQKHLRKKGLDQGWFEEKFPVMSLFCRWVKVRASLRQTWSVALRPSRSGTGARALKKQVGTTKTRLRIKP